MPWAREAEGPIGETEGPTVKTNRISPYEAGWLTLLVSQGICTRRQAQEAMRRVAQDAIDGLERRRRRRRRRGRNRREDE